MRSTSDSRRLRALTPADRKALLEHARRTLVAHLSGMPPPPDPVGSSAITDIRASFVTLRVRATGALRGCIGESKPRWPLVESIGRASVSAATADPRFLPVTSGEVSSLTVAISALGPLLPIEASDIEVGRHGVLIAGERGSALLLPHVATTFGWDREEFLARLCEKAGLTRDAWTTSDIGLLGFEADTWEEE